MQPVQPASLHKQWLPLQCPSTKIHSRRCSYSIGHVMTDNRSLMSETILSRQLKYNSPARVAFHIYLFILLLFNCSFQFLEAEAAR